MENQLKKSLNLTESDSTPSDYDDCSQPLKTTTTTKLITEDLDQPIDEEENENDENDFNDELDDEDNEHNRESAKCVGLFSSNQVFDNVIDMFDHEMRHHKFNLIDLVNKYQMDMISYIKMINFIRTQKPNADLFLKDFKSIDELPWSDDSYMKTAIDNDAALQFDVEEDLDMLRSKSDAFNQISNSESETIRCLKLKLKESNGRVEELTEVADRLRTMASKLLTKSKKRSDSGSSSTSASGGDESSSDSEDDDKVYKDSYSNYSIHLEMLQDSVRTNGYMKAILNNPNQFKDKVVLDVGCGTGILSLFAAKAGAKLVIAVDMSNIIDQAIQIAKENGYENKIVFLRGKVEEVKLPVAQVDIIVSEWMGYFLLFESMLDSVLFARDKYLLSPNKMVLPNYFEMHLFAVSDMQTFENKIGYWSDVYGFKMSCMRQLIIKDSQIQVVENENVISDYCRFKTIDCQTCTTSEIREFASDFSLKIDRDCQLTALGSCFDTFFNHDQLDHKSSFSTSPSHEPTHWQQTVFQLDEPIKVSKGQTITGRIECVKNPNYARSYLVDIHLFDRVHKFIIE